MTGYDVENFYFTNPPFEITDKIAYLNFLQFQSQITMVELSENDPVISEALIGPLPATNPDLILSNVYDNDETERVLFDLRTVSPSFLEIVVLEEVDKIADMLHNPASFVHASHSRFGFVGSVEVATAMRSNSVLNLLAVNDYLPIIEEWFATRKEFMVYDNFFVKLRPLVPYFILYRRYKTIAELRNNELRIFKDLLGVNLMLDIYQSAIFSAEGGIKSVSLSGLAVSFNVPEQTTKVRQLLSQKAAIMNRIAIDYSDGLVGLI